MEIRLLLVLEQQNISALLCYTSGVCLLLNLISLQQIFLWRRLGQCTLHCTMCLPLHVVHNVYCIYPQDRRSTHSIRIHKAVDIHIIVSYTLCTCCISCLMPQSLSSEETCSRKVEVTHTISPMYILGMRLEATMPGLSAHQVYLGVLFRLVESKSTIAMTTGPQIRK